MPLQKPPLTHGPYKHYKGCVYIVSDVVLHTETQEWYVLYHDKQNPELQFVRPYTMFTERIKVAGKLLPRFTQLNS